MTLRMKASETIVEKGEHAGNQHFLLFQQCFLHFSKQILIFGSHLFCRLQVISIWTRQKFCRLVKRTGRENIARKGENVDDRLASGY